MTKMKLSAGAFIALIAVGGVLPHFALADSAELVYQNDFSTRTTYDLPPGAAWTTFKYTPRIPLADNYECRGIASGSNLYYTRPYGFVPDQDGWTKSHAYALRANYVHTTVSDESNPALVFSNKDAFIYDTDTYAIDHQAAVMHPLRNVFTNGMLKAQFDIRQPASYSGNVYCWFRLEQEYDMKINHADTSSFPIEVGLTSGQLAGGWRPVESNAFDNVRVYYTFGAVAPLHWYRYYITYNIDNLTFEFDVYDLGTGRIPMDAMPSGSPMAKRSGLFRHTIASRGGISGVMIRHVGQNTGALYGEEGYNDDKAYKIDNIKVAWQKPGTTGYVDCYRNDFTKSERRTIDGRPQMSHTYVQQEVSDSLDFTYRSDFVRVSSNHTANDTPHLTPRYDSTTRDGKAQLVGLDGWRISGNNSYKANPVVTTNNANQMLYCSSFGMAKQLMCQPITNGIVKFEIDQKMPAGWTGTPRCDIDLMSEESYDQGVNNTNDSHYRFGLSSSGASGSTSKIEESYGVYAGGVIKSVTPQLKPLTWYRLQVIANLDTKKASLYVYEIGPNAPAKPEDFDPGDTSNAVAKFEGSSFETFGSGVRRPGIAAWGFTNFLNSQGNVKDAAGNTVPAEDVAFHVDNVRFWKQNGAAWELVFYNDFSTSKRNFTRKSVDLNPELYIDRPEYGEDGWASCPTYNMPVQVTGDDSVIQFRDQYVSVVHPLGRNIRSGKMSAQYDVRLPAYWVYNIMQVEFGGATLASASTASSPVRFNGHSAIRTGFARGGWSSGSGGNYSKAAVWYDRGKAQGGEESKMLAYTWGQEFDFNEHWIRVKIEADVSKHKFDVAYYDMGKEHPTFDTPEGALLVADGGATCKYEGADFRYSDEPISHIWIFGGQTWSYAPWKDNAPGALLVDNIRVRHARNGVMLIVR